MSRPRNEKNKDLPEGLYFKKSRGIYLFTKIDGSTKSYKDKKKAKQDAHEYNRTFRVDPELTSGLFRTSDDKRAHIRMSQPMGTFLPEMFDKVYGQRQIADGTLKNIEQRFRHILEHFQDISAVDLSLHHVREFLQKYDCKDKVEVYNRMLHIMMKVFDECVSEGYLETNPAAKRTRRPIYRKSSADRRRLTLNEFKQIHKLAGEKKLYWMQIAMELSLQTCHAVLEVSRMKYKDFQTDYVTVIRQKNIKNEASRVKIPMNKALFDIVQRSKDDHIESPYVVHSLRSKKQRNRQIATGLTDNTQLSTYTISTTFSALRDELGIQSDIQKRSNRSGFHDIRALSIFLYKNMSVDPQIRAAHGDKESTEIYSEGHEKWNYAEDAIIEWKNAS